MIRFWGGLPETIGTTWEREGPRLRTVRITRGHRTEAVIEPEYTPHTHELRGWLASVLHDGVLLDSWVCLSIVDAKACAERVFRRQVCKIQAHHLDLDGGESDDPTHPHFFLVTAGHARHKILYYYVDPNDDDYYVLVDASDRRYWFETAQVQEVMPIAHDAPRTLAQWPEARLDPPVLLRPRHDRESAEDVE